MLEAKPTRVPRVLQPGFAEAIAGIHDAAPCGTDLPVFELPEPDILPLAFTKRGKREYRDRLWQRSPYCRFCGVRIGKQADATIDHVIPQARGGQNAPANLILACTRCNDVKGCRTPFEWAMDILRGAEPIDERTEAKGGVL